MLFFSLHLMQVKKKQGRNLEENGEKASYNVQGSNKREMMNINIYTCKYAKISK